MDKKKNRKFTRRMQKKLAVLFILITLALIGLNIRITYINAKDGDKYKKEVLSQQQYDSRSLPYKRGDILDRNGTVLATSEKVYNVVIDCYEINSKETYAAPTIDALVSQFGLDESELREKLTSEETRESQYQVLKKEVTMEEKKAYEEYVANGDKNNIKGVWFEESYIRNYPLSTLACNLLGFSNANNDGNTGIEGYYNSTLNGVNGREFGYLNEDLELQRTIIQPENGHTLVSTIDVNIQKSVEKYIAEFDEAYKDGPNADTAGRGSKNTGVIVGNAKTGEILAMATSSVYDLNNPQDISAYYSKEETDAMNAEELVDALNSVWSNYCISNNVELGSTYKPITIAMALESGVLKGTETYECDGYFRFGDGEDELIRCVRREGHGTLTVEEALMYSCNDCLMQIVEQIGMETYQKYQDIFNFGRLTGIDLPGESQGDLGVEMSRVDLLVSSFGQTFTGTMLQEFAAFTSTINGGYYYQPQVVSQILDDNGRVVEDMKPNLLKQTISADTSSMIRDFLLETVENGTGNKAQVPGYDIGGKTGTAETYPRENGKYLVSFIGFAPASNPEIVIYVVVEEPNAEEQADSTYAQEIAQKILSEILPYMSIFPTKEIVETGEDNKEDTTDTDAEDVEDQDTQDEDSGEYDDDEYGEYGDGTSEDDDEDYNEDSQESNGDWREQSSEGGTSNPAMKAPAMGDTEEE